jgi:hypothetical protein
MRRSTAVSHHDRFEPIYCVSDIFPDTFTLSTF